MCSKKEEKEIVKAPAANSLWLRFLGVEVLGPGVVICVIVFMLCVSLLIALAMALMNSVELKEILCVWYC